MEGLRIVATGEVDDLVGREGVAPEIEPRAHNEILEEVRHARASVLPRGGGRPAAQASIPFKRAIATAPRPGAAGDAECGAAPRGRGSSSWRDPGCDTGLTPASRQ